MTVCPPCVQHLRSVVLFVVSLFFLTPAAVRADYAENFDGTQLNSIWQLRDGYAVQHPADTANRAVFQMTGTQLSIAFPGGQEHNMWWVKHASALRPYSGTGTYETKVDTSFTGDQQVGLVFQQDPNNFLIFMLYSYNGDTVRGYVERFNHFEGVQNKTTFYGGSIGVGMPAAGPFYIRVAVTDNGYPAERNWTFSWSANGTNWNQLVTGQLEGWPDGEHVPNLQSVGVFAGNQPSLFSSYNARFDYFRFYGAGTSAPPTAPENVVARGGDGSADVWWDAVVGASSYKVYGASAQAGPFTLLTTTSQTSFSQAPVTNNVARFYAVATVKNGVESAKSSAVKAVPHSLGMMATLPTSGLQFALNAAELSHVLNNGAAVSHWPSAFGPKVAASAATNLQPVYVTAGLNGQPAVRFDGVNDYMKLPSGFTTFTSGSSLYVVMRASVPQNGFKLLLLGNGADQQNIGLGRASSSSGFEYFTDSSSEVSWFNTTDGLVAGESMLISVLQDGGTANGLSFAELAKNGTPLFGQNLYVPPVATRGSNLIGKSYWADGLFQGDIAEMLLYNRKLSPVEHAAVLSYVQQKYGIGGGTPPPEPLQAPAQLTATAGQASVQLQWNAVTGATGYRVYRAVGTSQTYTQIASVTTTSYTNSGLANGTTYKYKVSAYDSDEESAQTAVVSATPTASPPPTVNLPTSGLILLLKADTAAAQYSNGQAVTVWDDSSASNYDATAGAGAPSLVTNALNGKPVLRFDGYNDYLQLPAGFQNFTAGMSLFIVSRPTEMQTGFKFLALGNGPSQQNIGLGRAHASAGLQFWTDNSSGNTSWFDTSYGLQSYEASLLSVTQASGAANTPQLAQVAKNGVVIHSENVYIPPVTSRAVNYIGKSYWDEGMFQGDIAEIILYNRQLTSTEQSTVKTYIAQKYGLTIQ